jgi:hypothetical protein
MAVEMYRSRFIHLPKTGGSTIRNALHNGNLFEWLERITTEQPGWYHHWVKEYTGNFEIDFIGRTENLINDLTLALLRAGEDFDWTLLRGTKPHGVTEKNQTITESNFYRVINSEEWYYDWQQQFV